MAAYPGGGDKLPRLGGVMRPPSRLAPDWARALIKKTSVLLVKRRSRWHPSLRSWVNRCPLGSGQWPKNGQNATSPITSYLSKLEPRVKDQNVPYGLTALGSKLTTFFCKNCHFYLAYFMTPMTIFRHIWITNGCQIQNQRTKLPLWSPNPNNDMTSSKVTDLWWPRLTSERSQCQYKPWISPPPTPIHVHISSKNTEVRKFQALKLCGTQSSLDMTLEIRSQVKGHSRYGLQIFREGVKLFKG